MQNVQSSLAQQAHALHPGANLGQHFGLVYAVCQKGVCGCGHCRKVEGGLHLLFRKELAFALASQSVSGLSQVYVVLAEGGKGQRAGGHKGMQRALPARLAVVCGHVPSIVGNAVKAHLAGFGIFHRIGAETAHQVVDVLSVAVGLAHEQTALAIVVHGIVEPDEGLALDLSVNPFHVILLNHVHHAVAGPHNAYLGIHLGSQGGQIIAARPCLVILGGTHDEGLHVCVLAHKLVGNVVEQSGLLVALGSFAPDVVKEDGKGADAQRIHLLQLFHHGHRVCLVPLDVASGMDGPYKLHFVAVGSLHQLAQQGGFLLGVGLTPLGTVVGVVLGTIDIDVHLVLAIEVELAQTVLVAPGIAIEALNDTTARNAGPVGDLALHHLGLAHHLQQALHAIVCTVVVLSGNHNLVCRHLQIVTLCLGGNLFLEFLYGLVSLLAQNNGLGQGKLLCIHLFVHAHNVQLGGKQFHSIAVGPVGAHNVELLRVGESLSAP